VRRRVNVAWVLEALRRPVFVWGGVSALVVVAMRRGGVGLAPCATVFGLGFLVALGVGIWRARSFWMRGDMAFARLDAVFGWNSRLSAARQGVGPWPERPEKSVGLGVRWCWKRVMAPWGLALGLGILAFQVPQTTAQIRHEPIERPPMIQQVESLLAELEQNAVVAPENLESFKDQLDQLKNKPSGEWYSHHALEAAAQLQAAVESGARSAGEQLARLEEALAAPGGGDPSPQQMEQIQQQLRAALEGPAAAPAGIDPQLAKKLRESASQSGLDPKEWKDLKDRLSKAREAAKCEGGAMKCDAQSRGKLAKGFGTDDDGASAALTYSAIPTDLGGALEEALPQGDLSRAVPGDAVNEKRLAPKAEEASSVGAPGASSVNQSGAPAVWMRRPLAPAEQRRLRVFFEN
jgi:hypothetical protein